MSTLSWFKVLYMKDREGALTKTGKCVEGKLMSLFFLVLVSVVLTILPILASV